MKVKKILLSILVIGSTLLLSGCSIFKQDNQAIYKVDLEVWGVFDDSDAYAEIFSEYKKINPYIGDIRYRKLNVDTYKEDLVNALASGKGPDIFMIRNAWRSSFEDKMVPAPANLVSEQELKSSLIDVAVNDGMSRDKKIYSIPASVDSLALYYNKDLFNAAGISQPPTTWEELLRVVNTFTKIDQFGTITQSGVALGTAYNINRSTDLLALLMLQYGAPLFPEVRPVQITGKESQNALEFYAQFARLGSSFYTWNPRQSYSIDAFYQGQLAMMINYSWHYGTLMQKNAKLNIGIAPLPQFSGKAPVNVANYWAYAVAKNKAYVSAPGENDSVMDPGQYEALRTHESWQLLRFLTLGAPNKKVTLYNGLSGTFKEFPLTFDPTEKYLTITRKPAARRDLIEKQKADVVFGPFVKGNLIAKNWYQGNIEAAETMLAEAIDNVNRGARNTFEALALAANRINLLP